jgi:hypothetical protein
MTGSTRLRIAAATGAITLLAGAGSAFAVQGSTITVGATVINGTRTLNVKDVAGGAVSSLALGAGHGGALLINVSDINYAHVGYQVTATMSNLYPYSGSYQFGQTPIPSSAVSLSFPGGLLDIANLSTLVTPVIHLTDSAAPFTALTPLNATVTGTTTSVSTLASTVTQATIAALGDRLPVRIAAGGGGPFTNPAGVTGQSGSFSPTAVDVLDGTAQSLAALLADLKGSLNNAKVTAQDFVTAGLLDQNSVLAAAAAQLGLTTDQLTGAQITQIMNAAASVTDLLPLAGLTDKVLGQTGSYNTVSQLALQVPSQQPAGNYQGELTLTLMDK